MAIILFVDDEPLTLKLLSQAANILGHQALTSSNQEGAFALAVRQNPDLIVTDINLAGQKGLELVRRFKTEEATKDIPVVTLSALEPIEVEATAREYGAVASLSKPIRLQTLLEVIREYTQEEN
ncbi:MAG: response regulator [Chloroflexi bacterium]|nr:response regulator [Chloroflexota bacterium]